MTRNVNTLLPPHAIIDIIWLASDACKPSRREVKVMIDFDGNGEEEECCDFVLFDKCSPRSFLEVRKLCRVFNEGYHLINILRRLEISLIDVRTEIPKFWETNLRFVHAITLCKGLEAKEMRRFNSLIKDSHAHKVEIKGARFHLGIDEKILRAELSGEKISQFDMDDLDPTVVDSKHTVILTDCYMNNYEEVTKILGRGTIHTLVIDDCSDISSATELTKEGGGSGSIHTLHINHCKHLVFHTTEFTSINELRDTRCKWAFHDDESRHMWDDGILITDGGRCKKGIHRTNVGLST